MNKWHKFLFGFLILTVSSVQAKVRLPEFFSGNMVLQRDMPVRIWGWADVNEPVTAYFNGISKKTRADKSGKWTIQFPSMPFGGPHKMSVKGRENTVVLENILIGDVWLCSGQSNMGVPLLQDYTAGKEIIESENKQIRLLKIPRTIQTKEHENILPASWMECNSTSSPDFSAVAYFFGKNLQKSLDVPIGLIEASFGGTGIEAWTSWEASMNNEKFSKYKGHTIEEVFGHPGEEMNNIFNAVFLSKDEGTLNKWFLSRKEKSGWKNMYAPKAFDGELQEEDGVIWFRKEINLPADLENKPGKLHLGIGSSDQLFLNGAVIHNSFDNMDFDITVKGGTNLIAVRFLDLGGAGGFRRRSPDQFYLESQGRRFPLEGEWEYKPAILASKLGLKTLYLPNNFASLLYNGMIHPLVRFGIKGVIWYQGEGDTNQPFQYRSLFRNLINDWRKQWGYDFPFIWAQLPGFQPETLLPGESEWAELREAQNMALKLPKTGQAVITDLGDALDIHPKNKKDVGFRLAQSALRMTYGKNGLGSGPVYENMDIQGNKMILHFSNTGTGLGTSDKNKYGYAYGFSIAGEDRKFKWAKAFIQGNDVIVFSDLMKPVAVRYGWASNPREINIVNSDGFLASPFRTDDWKIESQNSAKEYPSK